MRSKRGSADSYRCRLVAPVAVQSILKSALRRNGLDREIERYNFVLYWDKIVGPDIAKRARPDRIRGNKLYIKVGNSVWLQELSFHKKTILQRVGKYVSNEVEVEDIVFFVGEV